MEPLFRAIEDLFVNMLFAPFDLLRGMENWWAANALNWLFVFIALGAFVFWMLQLKNYNASGTERKDVTSHTYL